MVNMVSLDNMRSNRRRAIKLDINNHPHQHGPLHQLNNSLLSNTGNIIKTPPALNLNTKPTTPNPIINPPKTWTVFNPASLPTKPKPPASQHTTKPNSPKSATTPTRNSPV